MMHEKFAVGRASGYVFPLMARYYSGQNQPLGTWNNLPIYLTTILTAALVVGLIGSAVLMAGRSPLLEGLILVVPLQPSWSIWRLFTYVFVEQISFFTPFSIFFFYWFSVGIETHLGRIALARLLVLLVLAPAILGAFWWWALGVPTATAGVFLLTSGMLVAFATLYPKTEAMGWVPFKWVAFACIFCGSLMLFANRDWPGLSQLWFTCAVGFAYIWHAKEQEYDDYIPPLRRLKEFFRPKPKFRVVPTPETPRYRAPILDEPVSELDVLLDKIAKSGMASLTAKEQAQLQKAREALMRKDQR
jgi:hypothetical protein